MFPRRFAWVRDARCALLLALVACSGGDGEDTTDDTDDTDDTPDTGPGLLNGDFSQDLQYWEVYGSRSDPAIGDELSYGCLPDQTGNNYVYLDVWVEGEAYVEQAFDVPSSATDLTLRLWNALDPALARFSVFVGSDETILGETTPPSVQALEDEEDPLSVICSGEEDSTATYPIDAFAGMPVTLRLAAIGGPGNNGTIMSFDDVVVD